MINKTFQLNENCLVYLLLMNNYLAKHQLSEPRLNVMERHETCIQLVMFSFSCLQFSQRTLCMGLISCYRLKTVSAFLISCFRIARQQQFSLLYSIRDRWKFATNSSPTWKKVRFFRKLDLRLSENEKGAESAFFFQDA